MKINKLITAITVNYKTLDLIEVSVTAFRKFYPNIQLIIIDGSSFDRSSNWIYEFAKADKNTRVLFNNYNIHHGPGLDAGLRLTTTPFAFTFDTDTTIKEPDLIENMFEIVHSFDKEFYSIGTLHNVNEAGIDIVKPYDKGVATRVTNIPERQMGIHYIHPRAKIINVQKYFSFAPFIKHGAPCIASYIDINRKKYQQYLYHFPVHKYIDHPTGRGGTVSRTGGFHL